MPETLYLIDGFAQIFRAYYAIRGGMRSPVTGEPTHAVFGVGSLVIKLLRDLKPAYVAVAMDSPGKTFRDDLYEAYKGTRRETPEDLLSQIPRVVELFERFGIATISQSDLEADDVIATIVERVLADPASADVHIRIASKDKDLEQLLSDRVSMFDIQTDTLTDVAALLANKGITPAQVVDVLTLTGDTVDNVPGVDGIGLKTAAQLVQQFGSIEGIYANLAKLTPKRREALEKAQAHLPLSRTLVTLKRDGSFPFSLEAVRVRQPDPAALIPFFEQLGFNRFQDDVKKLAPALVGAAVGGTITSPTQTLLPLDAPQAAGVPAAQGTGVGSLPPSSGTGEVLPGVPSTGDGSPNQPETAATGRYRAIATQPDLEELVATLRRQNIIAVDTETTGLTNDAKLCGISLSWEHGQGVYVPVRSPAPDQHLDEATVLTALKPVLEDESIGKCGHHLKFDARILWRSGVRLRGVVFDSMLASQLLDPSPAPHKLDHLALILLNYLMIPISDLIGTPPNELSIDQVPLERVVTYAAEDADIALRLYHQMAPRVAEAGMDRLLREVESPLTVVLAEMEGTGIVCDPAELSRQGELLSLRTAELKRQIWDVAETEFTLESPKQLAEVLYEKLALPKGKKTKTGYSTDVEELERLAALENKADPRTSVPRLLIEYRQLHKLISTYLGTLTSAVDPTTGRIHTTFHQLLTATGRLASQGPNLQNIPVRSDIGRQVRKAFVAPPDHQLICADYSQVELRILAHLSGDPGLVAAFRQDQDIHAAVASQVFGVAPDQITREQRTHAKTINFGIIYGVTAFGLARRIDGLDLSAASKLIADYKERFAGIDRFLQQCIQHAMEYGYVTTMLGRRRAIPEIQSSNQHQRGLGERLAINSVVQGSAADLIKVAMVNVQRRIDRDRLPIKLLLQIHDELVFEAPSSEAKPLAAIVQEEMERAVALNVPLRAEAGIGPDWMSAK
jgi:DNA polymerase I